jgi:EmrB/QacA subfamily drug resistance transporter
MNQKVAVSVVYVAAMFMAIMDTTIVNVALPTLGREFHVRSDAVDTVVIAFLVSLAVFIPTSGWLGDRFGGKKVLLGAIAVFTAASALCGLAQSLPELVAFRVLQGAGGGLMTPVGMAMLFRTFPPAERVRASSILTVPTAFAPALGPVLGGIFVTELSWRWVFYVNLPIGIAALVFGALFLADHRQGVSGPFDVPGFVLAGAGLGLFMYGLSVGPIKGWSDGGVIVATVCGAVLLGLLVVVELRRRYPLVDLRLYANRLFRTTTVVMLFAQAGFLGTLYLVALFFQDGLGLSALESGLLTFPEAIGVMAGSQLVTRVLYPVLGPRRVMRIGLPVVVAAMAGLALVGVDTNLWLIRLDMFFLGAGMSHVFIPAQAAAFATLTPGETGRASMLFNTQRQISSAVGVAVLTTVLAAVGTVSRVAGRLVPDLTAYHAAFLVAASFAVLALLATRGIDDAEAAATFHYHGPATPARAGGSPSSAAPPPDRLLDSRDGTAAARDAGPVLSGGVSPGHVAASAPRPASSE